MTTKNKEKIKKIKKIKRQSPPLNTGGVSSYRHSLSAGVSNKNKSILAVKDRQSLFIGISH